MKKLTLLVLSLSLVISVSRAATTGDSLVIAPFGKVYIYNSADTPKNVILFISGDAGWRFGVVGFAREFSDMGNLVVGINAQQYYKNLRQRTGDCYHVAADFVQLATLIEKKFYFSTYRPPVIMGYSSGASLVYGILAQARPGTFVGGISLGFCPEIDLPKKLCQTNGLSEITEVPGKSYVLEPDAKLGNPWIVLQGQLDKVCNFSQAEDFVNQTTDAELVALPNVGHGFSKWSDFMPQFKDAFSRIVSKYEKSQQTLIGTVQLKDFPLVITQAKRQDKNSPFVLLLSGDGGWYSFEQSIADSLAELGIPTIGFDSKKYFWNRRTPEETTSDLEKIADYFSHEWGKEKVLLMGYSLGAELIPFIINKWQDDLNPEIVKAVLFSPDTKTDFEIHLTNMIGLGNYENSYNVTEEIRKIKKVPVLCIFGEDEDSRLPGLLAGTLVKTSYVPGDHHYNFNIPLILKTLRMNGIF